MKRLAVSSRAAADEPPLDDAFLARQSALEVIFERSLPHALSAARHLQSKEVLASLLSLALALQEQDVESYPLRRLQCCLLYTSPSPRD